MSFCRYFIIMMEQSTVYIRSSANSCRLVTSIRFEAAHKCKSQMWVGETPARLYNVLPCPKNVILFISCLFFFVCSRIPFPILSHKLRTATEVPPPSNYRHRTFPRKARNSPSPKLGFINYMNAHSWIRCMGIIKTTVTTKRKKRKACTECFIYCAFYFVITSKPKQLFFYTLCK